MASYYLKDTGYANTSEAGTQETMANSGTALPLYIESLDWKRSTGHSANANPGTYEATDVSYASVSNPPLVIRGVLQVSDSSYETHLKALDDLCTTKGLKLFYYSSTTDGFKPMTSVFGATSYGSLQVDGTTKALLVRCTDFQISEPSNVNATKGLRRYTMSLIITNPQ